MLFSLYQAHAALCARMAETATSPETKTSWQQLADHCAQKANNQRPIGQSAETQPSCPLPAVPSPDIGDEPTLPATSPSPRAQSPNAGGNSPADTTSPALTPTPSLQDATRPALNESESHSVGQMDDDWDRLLADIRGK